MSSFLKFSERVSLAFHAMAALARHPEWRIAVPALAAELSTSPHTLGSVMALLARAGLVQGSRGPRGGFQLARSAADMALMDIYEAVEGALPDHPCLLHRPVCKGETCLMLSLVHRVTLQTRELFAGTSLQTLADDVAIGDARWAVTGPEP